MAISETKKGSRRDFSAAVSAAIPDIRNKEVVEVSKKEYAEVERRSPGRPTVGKTVKITLAIPEDLMAGIDCAALLHKGNRTAYINHLIAQDLKANIHKYEEVRDMIKTANG